MSNRLGELSMKTFSIIKFEKLNGVFPFYQISIREGETEFKFILDKDEFADLGMKVLSAHLQQATCEDQLPQI